MKRLILFPVIFVFLLMPLDAPAYTNICGDDGNAFTSVCEGPSSNTNQTFKGA